MRRPVGWGSDVLLLERCALLARARLLVLVRPVVEFSHPRFGPWNANGRRPRNPGTTTKDSRWEPGHKSFQRQSLEKFAVQPAHAMRTKTWALYPRTQERAAKSSRHNRRAHEYGTETHPVSLVEFRVCALRPRSWRCWAYTQLRDPSWHVSLLLGSPHSVSPRDRQPSFAGSLDPRLDPLLHCDRGHLPEARMLLRQTKFMRKFCCQRHVPRRSATDGHHLPSLRAPPRPGSRRRTHTRGIAATRPTATMWVPQ